LFLEPLEARVVPTLGSLRIVSYNVANAVNAPLRAGLDTVLQAVGAETVQGHQQPIDVLALQEVLHQNTTTQAVVNLLNGIYGAGVYGRGTLDGATTGDGTEGVVYDMQTVRLLSETTVGTASTTGQPRQALRYLFQPVGYGPDAAFYLYDSHYKAGTSADERSRRLAEAAAIRADADALGPGVRIVYAGDFNTYGSEEPGYQRLLSDGNGRAIDPVNRPGHWSDDPAYAELFTYASYLGAPIPGRTGDGLDDRFDFQLITSALADGTGLEYRTGSYHAFGNNGTVPLNGSVDDPANTALPDLPNRQEVLHLLATVSDHLPLVADYDLLGPATPDALGVTADTAATTAGQPFPVTVTARNGPLVAAGYRGTVHFASDDPQAALPDDYTFTEADQGSHAFTVTRRTAGGHAVTVTDAAAALGATTDPVAVSPDVAASLVIAAPLTAAVGVPFGFTVTAVDAYGNTVTGYAGTVAFASLADPAATLPAPYQFTADDQGTHGFTAGAAFAAVGPLDLTATDPGGLTGVAWVTVA
jgi:endonuclease/exonuclease/phosphatase family metal-dependent hydrolase